MADKNASAAVPFQIGGFKIVRQVGEGSFGSVYLAKHQGTEGYVAIKAARRTVDKKAMATRNSLIEIEGAILQQLSHKNIVKVYKCFEEAGVKALVLEFLSGIDLCKLLPSGKPGLEEREAAIIVRYILEGLNYLHSLNIVHRDVKPSRLSSLGNILIPLSRDYTNLKLTDFGLSVSLSSLNKKALTADCGTTMYMSPERLLNKVYDTKADVFSVGVVMLEILNGRFSQEMLNRQKGHSQDFFRYYNWDRHCSDLPSAAARHLFERLVQRDPERRYSAIQALSHPWITGKTDAELPLTPRENVEAGKTRLKLKISLVALSILTHLQYSGKNDLQPEQTTRGSSASKKLSSPSKLRVQNDPAPKFRLLRRSIVKEKPVGPEKVLLIRSRAYNTKGSHPHSTSLQGQLRDDNALKAPKSRNSEKLHDTPTKVLVSKALSGSFKEESQQKCHQHDSEERVSVPAFTSTYFSKCKTVSHQCILEAMSKPRLSKDHTVKNATDSALEKLFPVISKLQPDQAPSPDSFQSKGCLTFKVDHKKSRFETHRNTEVGRSLPTLGLTKLP